MIRLSLPAALLAVALVSAPVAADAAAQPGGVFVMDNASYPGLSALLVCATSARVMAEAFAKLGFIALRANGASNADAGAKLASLDTKLRAAPAPGETVAIYLCGYARALNGRSHLLPVDAGSTSPPICWRRACCRAFCAWRRRPVRPTACC